MDLIQEVTMNAQELTKCYFDDHNKLYEANKNIEYLLQDVGKEKEHLWQE